AVQAGNAPSGSLKTPRTRRRPGMRTLLLATLVASCLLPWAVHATVPGGGPEAQDCQLELGTPKPNYPISVPGKPAVAKELRCFDGDAGCDLDGEVNGVCRFPLDACLRVADRALPACAPADVTAFAVGGANGNADPRAPPGAGGGVLPATASTCTTGQAVGVALRGHGKKAARRTVKLKARTSAGTDTDKVRLTCLPHGWPSYGYDHRNRRAPPVETTPWGG